MDIQIKSALIGAIIPTVGAFAIFFLGDISTKSTLERDTVQVLSEKFDSVEKDMSYEDALQAIFKEKEDLKGNIKDLNDQIADLNDKVNSLNNQINEQQAEIKQQNSTEEINKIIQNATDYWNNSDFIQALTLLKGMKSMSTDVERLYKQYSIEYSYYIISQAELLISESQSDEAIEILKEASTIIFDDTEIRAKIDEISNKPSAFLANLIPVSGDIEDIWNAGERDNYGNTYTSGICLHQSYNNAAHVVYSLDGKYTVLTGKFVLDEASKNTDGNYVLYVYSLSNGNMSLIYESPALSTATRPIDVKIDVTDVMDLVIEVYDPKKGGSNATTGFVDAKLE